MGYGGGGEGKQQSTAQEGLCWLGEVGDSARLMRMEGKRCPVRWENEEESADCVPGVECGRPEIIGQPWAQEPSQLRNLLHSRGRISRQCELL